MVPGEHRTEDLRRRREVGRLFWGSGGGGGLRSEGWVRFNWVKNEGKRKHIKCKKA